MWIMFCLVLSLCFPLDQERLEALKHIIIHQSQVTTSSDFSSGSGNFDVAECNRDVGTEEHVYEVVDPPTSIFGKTITTIQRYS